MRRQEKQVSNEKSLEFLNKGAWGVLSFAGDEPYGVPLNYIVDAAGENEWPDLFLHCAPQGTKVDYIRKNPKVCFTVVAKSAILPDGFSTDYESVIAKAHAHFIDQEEEIKRVIRLFGKRFAPHASEQVEEFIAARLKRTLLIRLRLYEVKGKAI